MPIGVSSRKLDMLYLPLDSSTIMQEGGTPDDILTRVSRRLANAHQTDPLLPRLILSKRPRIPPDTAIALLTTQIESWKAKEAAMRLDPFLPVCVAGTATPALLTVGFDGLPRQRRNPFYSKAAWKPSPLALNVVGICTRVVPGHTAAVESGIAFEDSREVRALMAELRASSSDWWRHPFEIIRGVRHLPAIPIFRTSLMSLEEAQEAVEDTELVRDGDGKAKVGGMGTFKFDRIVLASGSDEGGWEDVASVSLV
ncbi:hypothetical protein RQP46_004636 [Phenoliferia psychrophenolica]